MRTAIYARLSQDRSGESENVEIQKAECREYVGRLGWEIVQIFTDDDISASRYSLKPRLGYQALLEYIKHGRIEAVLVTEMPRLYRQLEELLELLVLSEHTPLRRIETTDGNGYDLSTAMGYHNAVSAVNNAVLESRKISDRTKRKKRARAMEGAFNGGRRPYGFEGPVYDEARRLINPGKVGMVVVEEEAAIIQEMASRVLAGETVIGIVRDLNGRGVPTAEGGRWRTSSIRRLLNNKRIMGVRVHQGAEYPAAWPAILDAETWEHVQLVLKAEGRANNDGNKRGRTYLLTGMVFCGRCDAPLVGFANRNEAGAPPKRRYFCKRYDDHGAPRGCAGTSRLADPVEAVIAEAVLEALDSPQMAELLKDASQTQEMAELVNRYQAHKAKMTDLVEDYASGLLSREQLGHAKRVVEAAMQTVEARLRKLQSGLAFSSIPLGRGLRETWESSGLDWRRQLVSLVVEKVVLHPSRPGPRRWPADDDQELLERTAGVQWCFEPGKVELVWRV